VGILSRLLKWYVAYGSGYDEQAPKLQVSFAEYRLIYRALLQKRPMSHIGMSHMGWLR